MTHADETDAPRPDPAAVGPADDLLPEDGHQRCLAVRTGLLLLSLVLFAVGVLLWPVPFASGIPFHVAAVVTLGMASSRTARLVNRLERRLPLRLRRGLRPLVRLVRNRFAKRSEQRPDPDA